MKVVPKINPFGKRSNPLISNNSSFNTNKIILQEGDTIIDDTGEICEIFNNYFASVASDIGFDDTIPTDFDTDDGFSAITSKYCRHPSIVKIKENTLDKALFDSESITSRNVENIINGYDSKKAHGYHKMPMKLLQKCAKYIAPDIAKLINNSFSKCVFPNDLKFAEVSSLFKRNDALNKSNYRPVSILITLSKIYEKALSCRAF